MRQPPTVQPVDALVELWNRTKPRELAGSEGLKGKIRDEASAALLAIHLDDWPAVIARLLRTPHCLGYGSTGWKATLPWLVKVHREPANSTPAASLMALSAPVSHQLSRRACIRDAA